MRQRERTVNPWARILVCTLMFVVPAAGFEAQSPPDFSGLWQQDNGRCQPKRNGDVVLRIDHRDPGLTVETTITRGSEPDRRAAQRYTTDGRVSASVGADGDEFLTAVVWQRASLVFSIEEHEDGRILRSQETWSLIEGGATLQRIRERQNGEKQVLFFRRQR